MLYRYYVPASDPLPDVPDDTGDANPEMPDPEMPDNTETDS